VAIEWNPFAFERTRRFLPRPWPLEFAESVFSIVIANLAEIVEKGGSFRNGGFVISFVDRFEVFPF
jgi:hypothetical protein